MFQEIPNFLTHEECDLYIQLIDKQNQPSCVSGSGNEISKRDDKSRTSSTSSFNNHMLLHKALNEKIAQTLQLDIKKVEGLQGQKYQVGQDGWVLRLPNIVLVWTALQCTAVSYWCLKLVSTHPCA